MGAAVLAAIGPFRTHDPHRIGPRTPQDFRRRAGIGAHHVGLSQTACLFQRQILGIIAGKRNCEYARGIHRRIAIKPRIDPVTRPWGKGIERAAFAQSLIQSAPAFGAARKPLAQSGSGCVKSAGKGA